MPLYAETRNPGALFMLKLTPEAYRRGFNHKQASVAIGCAANWRNHSSSMSSDHSQCELSRRPESCSSSICSTKAGEIMPRPANDALLKWSQRNVRRTPRNHNESGTPKPIFWRLNSGGGKRSPREIGRAHV